MKIILISSIFFQFFYFTFSNKIKTFYANIFDKTPKDKRIDYSKSLYYQYLYLNSTIPANTTLFKISKQRIFTSCISFPYKEIIGQTITTYFKEKEIIHSEIFSEALIFSYQLLYYKYADLDTIKSIFEKDNDIYQYHLNSDLSEYLQIIHLRSKNIFYYDSKNETLNEYFKLYNLENQAYKIPSEVFDYVLSYIKEKSNEKARGNILKFIEEKKDEFIKLYLYIIRNSIPFSYETFIKVYKYPITLNPLQMMIKHCMLLSPMTDLLNTEINKENKSYSFQLYPFTDNNTNITSFLFFTKKEIEKGEINKYTLLSNEQAFFEYGKEYAFGTELFIKKITITINKDLFEKGGKDNKHSAICSMTNICNSLFVTKNYYKGEYILMNKDLNPFLMNLGRLINLKEEEITDVELFANQMMQGRPINNENELKMYAWYSNLMKQELDKITHLFEEDENAEEVDDFEIESLWKMGYLNYKVLSNNYEMTLFSIEKLLEKESWVARKLFE